MKNNKNDMIDKIILRCLTHNEVDLYSNMTQATIFCFWMLFEEMAAMFEANLTENIDVICQQHYCSSAVSVICYFIVQIDY